MVKYTNEQITALIIKDYLGKKCIVLSPIVVGRKGHYKELFETLTKRGYQQVRVDGEIHQLSEARPLDRYVTHYIGLVVDKLIPSEEDYKRVFGSVDTALEQGKGTMMMLDAEGGIRYFSRHLMCPDSGLSFREPAPHKFSFNSPQGACPNCKGLGYVSQIDISKIIPDSKKSINAGGIQPLGSYKDNNWFRILESMAKKYDFSLNDPIINIPDEILKSIIYGTDDLFRVDLADGRQLAPFPGIIAKLEQGSAEEEVNVKKERFILEIVCPECQGTRLKKEALYFKIAGKDISQVADMDMNELYEWVKELPGKLSKRQNKIASDLIKELLDRINFILQVGLSYLSLSRSTRSLSGGESQRIRLATQIGSKLVNVLYILDEPSIGLHQRDNIKLINSLKSLRDEGNSVMVVEHDKEMILSSDWLIDLGPAAGVKGGELLYSGTPDNLEKISLDEIKGLRSYTADYLRGIRKIEVPQDRREGNSKFLELKGATGNNLKHVNIRIPLGTLVGVSGVSGSGKSTLINETLMPILSKYFYRSLANPLPYEEIVGIENVDKLIEVDQSPIGRSPRSNPATYTNVFFFFLMMRRSPRSTLFPYTTLFRSVN